MAIKIIYKSTSELIPYARNSRTHDDNQVAQIAASIKEFGFTNPVLLDGENGIIAGHGRVMAAKKLGINEVPCIELSHLTKAQKQAYIIADNKLALNAGWDEEMLKIELEELKTEGFDIDIIGFSEDEIEELLGEQITEGLTDEDSIPEPPAEPKTKLGDVWLLGRHRLMCGDSTKIDDVEKLMGGQKADIMFTDPMYNDSIKQFCEVFERVSDHLLIMSTFKQCIDTIDYFKSTGYKFMFDLVLNQVLPSSMMNKKVPYYLHKNIVYLSSTETIFNCDNAAGVFSETGAGYYPSIIESCKKTGEGHGLSKNVEGIIKILSGFKFKTCCDLFAGGGSTLIACEKTNKQAFCMEIEPEYCDIIINRWQDYTGQKAIHEISQIAYDDI